MGRETERTSPEEVLHEVIRELRDEIRVLRQVLDELRDEVQWANCNVRESSHPTPRRFVLTSMPLDPGAKDWGINRLNSSDLPSEVLPDALRTQGSLF